MTYDEMADWVSKYKTKSEKIRRLSALGIERADIARALGVRYQFVRNVLVQPAPAKRATMEAAAPLSEQHIPGEVPSLSIDEAKLGLSRHFGVPVEAIEIIIRG